MSYNQPCDTFFVEDNTFQQQQQQQPRPNSQEYIKMMGRRRQEAMANELSRQACDAYMDDIIDHMASMEDATMPDVASIEIQQEIQWFMRPYLIDFLIEAHSAFQLLPETLHLAVNLLDRYCSRRVVYKRHYQLVGCAALLIAAKYGDKKERVPMIRELKSMCCSLYDEEMFTQMEWHVLNTLEWMIGHPTVDSWLQLALLEGPEYEDMTVEHMSWYICEMALYHKEFVSVKPSAMARASLALSRDILGCPEMDTYGQVDSELMLSLSRQLNQPSSVLARKYAAPHLSRVSEVLRRFLLQQAAMSQCHVTPPTPPAEPATNQKSMQQHDVYSTPQKVYGQHVINGYLTPPITPEGEYFGPGNGNEIKPYQTSAPRCPITPTPQTQMQYSQQQQYQQQPYQQDIVMQ
ncbi:hypothetical protein BCIN_01g04640 [Botrytis cinerea B05.10]|jgi:hypothetical protein|uniref:Uncharacterized protein n=3 Tax=Botryotinia fuckeliana TaxID=40559 RepID=A0A384J5D4_BOTFB|nr:hypothetical protein BCIN_01g04640 [Botrytis cinerea B05.10]ATZ45740.1 hypothetical protein BCIN_01g04640 [Botrytis cinerea B05.10]EMR86124.1 putative g1 s-specific protein [Botrytis cinerea BcDW1]